MLGKSPEGMPQTPIEPWVKGRWVFHAAKSAWTRRDSWCSSVHSRSSRDDEVEIDDEVRSFDEMRREMIRSLDESRDVMR